MPEKPEALSSPSVEPPKPDITLTDRLNKQLLQAYMKSLPSMDSNGRPDVSEEVGEQEWDD